MPEYKEKVIEILARYAELSMINLRRELGMGNINSFIELINGMEKKEYVKTRHEGRERLVRLFSPIKTTNHFITNYPNRLKYFKKSLEKELKSLEKNWFIYWLDENWSLHCEQVNFLQAIYYKNKKWHRKKFYCVDCGTIFIALVKSKNTKEADCPCCD